MAKQYINRVIFDGEDECDAHNWFVQQANQQKIQINKAVARLIVQAHQESASLVSTPEEKFYWANRRAKRRIKQLEELHKQAIAYLEVSTDEGEKDLRESCEIIGRDYEAVLDYAERFPSRRAITLATSGDDTKTAECTAWLSSVYLTTASWPSQTVLDLGSERGYSDWMIRKAKKTLSIKSVHVGKHWDWVLGEEENTNLT